MSEVTIEALQPVMLVTCAWYAVSAVFLQLAGSGNNLIKDATPLHKKWGDRTFGNLVEQSTPFLIGMWGHAVFVSPPKAAALGTAWVVIRLFYPVVWAATKEMPVAITMPNYAILIWMYAVTAAQLSCGIDLRSWVGGFDTIGCILCGALFMALFFAVTLPTQRLMQQRVFPPAPEESAALLGRK
mmetsp:Transcript_118719/g.206761  ORF Transcript_118719/g.206761 Transcript_118719/m.206761 type:complete len:185 (-) Transcript_118719:474-1028(-)